MRRGSFQLSALLALATVLVLSVCTPSEQENAVLAADQAICRAVINVDGGASEELLREILANLKGAALEPRDAGADR